MTRAPGYQRVGHVDASKPRAAALKHTSDKLDECKQVQGIATTKEPCRADRFASHTE